MKKHDAGAAGVLFICLTVFMLSVSSANAADDFYLLPKEIGLLINFSVPCDLNSAIAIPDSGGLLTPNLLAVGSQQYTYDGSQWVFAGQQAVLYNKTLAKVGRLYGSKDATVTFEIFAGQSELGTIAKASVTAKPIKSVYQMFAIPLQLLNVSAFSNNSNYYAADYVQRFGTQNGLPPAQGLAAKSGQAFSSKFSALYAFYLPFSTSPQLATRVPRCGDERFYGLQFGRSPGF